MNKTCPQWLPIGGLGNQVCGLVKWSDAVRIHLWEEGGAFKKHQCPGPCPRDSVSLIGVGPGQWHFLKVPLVILMGNAGLEASQVF